MRTAISESGRAVLESRIQTWIALEEGQLDQVHSIAELLAIDEEEVLDMLNTCANSRAALDRFGIEVFPEPVEPEPEPSCEKRAARGIELGVDDAGEWDEMPKLDRFLFAGAALLAVLGLVGWFCG